MSAAKKDPAFLFYPQAWIEGTGELTPEEKGIYITLLCHQHQKGDLSSDIERLARSAGVFKDEMERCWPNIKKFFKTNADGLLYNKRLLDETESRKAAAKVNKIASEYAVLIKVHKEGLKKADIEELKKRFAAEKHQFEELDTDDIKDAIWHWFTENVPEHLEVRHAASKIRTTDKLAKSGVRRDENGELKKIARRKKSVMTAEEVAREHAEKLKLSKEYKDLIFEWFDYRRNIKKPIKTPSATKAVDDLINKSGNNITVARKIMDQSIANGWQGLFELKGFGRNGPVNDSNKPNPKAPSPQGRQIKDLEKVFGPIGKKV